MFKRIMVLCMAALLAVAALAAGCGGDTAKIDGKLPFDADKDLTPVTMFPSGALQLSVQDKLPIKTLKEFIEYARKNKATFGTYSPASLPHMIADVLGRVVALAAKIEPDCEIIR